MIGLWLYNMLTLEEARPRYMRTLCTTFGTNYPEIKSFEKLKSNPMPQPLSTF